MEPLVDFYRRHLGCVLLNATGSIPYSTQYFLSLAFTLNCIKKILIYSKVQCGVEILNLRYDTFVEYTQY